MERIRQEIITRRWEKLSESERMDYREKFIDQLLYKFHKNFFSQLSTTEIIRERWFWQFMETAYDDRPVGKALAGTTRGDGGTTLRIVS